MKKISIMVLNAIFLCSASFLSAQQKYPSYDKDWKSVDSLSKKGLNQQAAQKVLEIIEKAKTENNPPQFIKGLMHKLRFESHYKEDYLETNIQFILDNIGKTDGALKAILHSVLADIYWSYYQNNRWKFSQRSETINFDNNDIKTWDIKKIVEQTLYHYNQSLAAPDILKKIDLKSYDDILTVRNNSKKYRPTLFDLLAHKACDFFISEEPDITRPAYQFNIDRSEDFAAYNDFVKINYTTQDSMSLKFYGIKTLQMLIDFHKNDKDPTALVDADLKRLSLIRNKSVHPQKDSLYLNALLNLKKQFAAYPEPAADIIYAIADYYYYKGLTYNPQGDTEYRWFLTKSLNECNLAIEKYPETDGAQNCRYLKTQILNPSLNISTSQAIVPGKPFLAFVGYKNVEKLHFRIAKVDPEWLKKIRRKKWGDDLVKELLKLSVVESWSQALPVQKDYQNHSVEIKMPALKLGFYVILASVDADFALKNNAIAYAFTWATNISFANRNADKGEMEFAVFDRTTGEPLKGITAEIYTEIYNYNSREYDFKKERTLLTDENGFLRLPPANDYKYFNINFIKGDDHYYTDNNFYQYRYHEPDKSKKIVTHFFTDRAIYRPGQTIHFKGIILETDEDTTYIKPKYQTNVVFYNANYEKVSELTLTSNEYGTISGTFTAPQGVLNGRMYIDNGSGRAYFQVEEYKRPKFETKFEPVKGTFKLNDSVTVKGIAKAYAGSFIDGAEVKYRVYRTASFPYWWWYLRGYYPSSPKMEIANGTVKTNEKGEYTITFKAIPDLSVSPKSEPRFTYNVVADVTDINGETHTANTSVTVGYKALLLGVSIPSIIEKTEEEPYSISTTNLMGQQENAKGTIEIYKLKENTRLVRSRLWNRPDTFVMSKEQFIADFPNDIYDDETNIYKWERGERVMNYSFDTGKDSLLRLKDLKNWKTGQYVLEIKSTDKYGSEVKELVYFEVYDSKEPKLNKAVYDWFEEVKNNVEPGEKAKFYWGTKATNVKLLFEIEKKGNIVERRWISLSDEKKLFEIPITEADRGGFACHLIMVKDGRAYQRTVSIQVPYSNKMLDFEYQTFRNKLQPGQQEEWKLKLKGKKGEKVAAEMLASMYDASLDAFVSHNWSFSYLKYFYSSRYWNTSAGFNAVGASLYTHEWGKWEQMKNRSYDALNWFGYYYYYRGGGYYFDDYDAGVVYSKSNGGRKKVAQPMMAAKPAAMADREERAKVAEETMAGEKEAADIASYKVPLISKDEVVGENFEMKNTQDKRGPSGELGSVKARTNFNENAFFYPHLETDANGDVIIKFTVPESLTKWKFRALAHTKDLKYGQTEKEVITQKELMVFPNAPRFLRESDKMKFPVKITNLSDNDLKGEAMLLLFDATTMKPIDAELGNTNNTRSFEIKKGQSTNLTWDIAIPFGYSAVTYRIVAKSGIFSDGEEMTLPVLTNRMLVTETMPLPIRGKTEKTYKFEKLINSSASTTLKHQKLTLEFTNNPAWYAIQALPYMMEYPYECSEQIFSRYYANSIASYIANSSPKIKAVFESWKNITPDALLSNLEKNQELKSLMLEETPWVLQGKDESERKRRVALLFDLNKMASELEQAVKKLKNGQTSNGGWAWFPGMPDDRYITQYIITGFGHLEKLGVLKPESNNVIWSMIYAGTKYLDNRIREDYEWLKKNLKKEELEKNHLSYTAIQYLYARSYFLPRIDIDSRNKEAFEYYKKQAKKYWLENNRYLQGMIALALHRFGEKQLPQDIIKSLKDNSLTSEELGMYWKDMEYGYYWYQAPIETQALLIEAFDEVAKDTRSVEDMKVWLLKNKQTTDWKTTRATAEACYALLLRGTDWLANDEMAQITIGNQLIDPKKMDDVKVEAGTGYFKTSWSAGDIKPEMGEVKVKRTTEGVSWGAVYWQYFEQLDKITPAATPLSLKKQLFVERNTPTGPVIEPVSESNTLKIGDKLKVRIEIRVDRDMEYVHLKDMRAAGFEPTNVISRYKYQDGLGYYESTKDAATNFFISYLKKGTYVFEYPMFVTHEGDFSNGITSIQCMYAPEFSSHSEGIRVKVEAK